MPNGTKKICLVTVSLAKGGAERSVALLSEMLSEKGHQVHIATLNDAVDYAFSGTLFNLGKYKSQNDTLFKRLLRFRKLRVYLVKHQFDFIIDHRPKNDVRREQFYLRYIYRGLKKIYVVHSARQQYYFGQQPQAFAAVFRDNFATVAVSKHIEEKVLRQNGLTNTVTIHNAYDPQWETQGCVVETLQGKPYILAYGRLDDDVKDFSFLIQTYEASKLYKTGVHLVILGSGKDEGKLKQLARETVCSDAILFYPFTPNPFPFIQNSHCVALTSRYEGFPMVLVESLSLGIPIVSLDIVSGPNEIIQHEINGLLVGERDIATFAKALRRLFDEPALYEHCRGHAKKSVAHFSKENIAGQWHRLLVS